MVGNVSFIESYSLFIALLKPKIKHFQLFLTMKELKEHKCAVDYGILHKHFLNSLPTLLSTSVPFSSLNSSSNFTKSLHVRSSS